MVDERSVKFPQSYKAQQKLFTEFAEKEKSFLQLQVSEVKTSQQIVRTEPAGANKEIAKLVTMLFNKSVKATCYFRQLLMWSRTAYVDEITQFTQPEIS